MKPPDSRATFWEVRDQWASRHNSLRGASAIPPQIVSVRCRAQVQRQPKMTCFRAGESADEAKEGQGDECNGDVTPIETIT